MNFGKKQSYKQQGNQVTLHYENQDVILTILKDDIIRVLVPYWMKDYKSKAIEGDKAVSVDFTVEDAGDATVIKTKSLTFTFTTDFIWRHTMPTAIY